MHGLRSPLHHLSHPARASPTPRCHPHKLQFQPQPLGSRQLVMLDAVAHNLAVYPTGFAHVMAQLPRLILLVRRP